MNHIYDSFIRKTDILTKALEKATERTRTMMYFVTFFSLVIIVTSFNAYLAWDRKLNANERLLLAEELKLIPSSSIKPYNHILVKTLKKCSVLISTDSIDKNTASIVINLQAQSENFPCIKEALDKYTDTLRVKQLILTQSDYFKLYLDRQKFTIPILGLSCYADDVYLIGGLGLLILLTYSFFSVRRENRIVQRISKSIDFIDEKDPKEYLHSHSYSIEELAMIKHNLLEYIFFGCVEFFLFNTGLTKTDIRIQPKDERSKNDENKNKVDVTNTSGRFVLSALYYLPIAAMSFALLLEIISLVQRHDYLNKGDFWELGIRYIVTGLFLTVNILQCYWISKLNNDNSLLIDNMFQKIIISRKAVGLEED